jgi:peroxiredoxin
VLIVDVKEPRERVAPWASRMGFTFPVLLDEDGSTAKRYAPEGVLPDLDRDQVPIASNLIIDATGRIRFYSLLDSRNFDAKLVALRQVLKSVMGEP